jgi:TPR repeat protein
MWRRLGSTACRSEEFLVLLLWQERGDLVSAERWLRQGAGRGSRDARYNLGLLLAEQGDFTEAFEWLRHAAQDGHRDAVEGLAW